MKFKFLNDVIIYTLLLAAACFLVAPFRYDFSDGLGVALGALWACANLFLIKNLLLSILLTDSRNFLKFFLLFGVKFPLLYYVGYLLLSNDYLSSISVLIGFSLLFVVIIFKAISNLIMRRAILFVVPIIFSTQLSASSLDADVPEIPNIISLISHKFSDAPWAKFLYEWDSLIFAILISIGLSLLFYFGTRNRTLIPSGLQNFLEWIVENLQNFLLDILGPEGKKYVPFLGTLFIYILTMNWMVLIPLLKPPSSSLNVTVALALIVFALVQYLNIKNYGFFGFIYHLAGSPKNALGWAMVPLMLPIEILTQFTRPLTLSLRLFGNVLGEDILIAAFALFGVTLIASYSSIPLPLQIPFMFLALLTGLMQALVFTLLSTIYILLSVPSPEHHE